MTDRINGLMVVLDRDFREDDVQCLVDAIKMLKGVQQVNRNVKQHMDFEGSRERHKIGMYLHDVASQILDGEKP